MPKSNFKIPVGLALTLVVGLIGFKDTGIFVNNFNAKLNNGTEVSYSPNDRAEITGEGASKTTFKVEANGNTFYVPKESLLKVDTGVTGYTVINNTTLYDEDGQVIKILACDEYLEFLESQGDMAYVVTEDGLEGYVKKDTNLDPDRIRNIVDGKAKEDLYLDNGYSKLSIKQGDTVRVAWFEKDYYIIYDSNKNKFNVNKDKISIFTNVESPVKEEVVEKVERTSYEKPLSLSMENAMLVEKIIDKAYTLIGSPYVYGDTGKVGYDCSGMIYALMGEFTDIKLPRTSKDMAEVGELVLEEDLEPGDFLFFTSEGGSVINHVALYVGDGKMIHASNSASSIIESPLDSYYFKNCFSHARRVFN
ncbi:MAG: C40 family peptidase [Bacillota bacterium]|nr:C40 family peptidase [Bacillota bacterium]